MRNRDIDFIKGVAIVLVVVGHALTDWTQGGSLGCFISSFHMPVFFIASGYFFKGEKMAEWRAFGGFLKSRVVRLWWPYVVWVMVFLLLNNWFIKCNVYTDNEAIRDFVPGMTDPHTTNTIKETIKAMLFTLPMVYRPEPVVALWFLKSLLVISAGYALVEVVTRRFSLRVFVVQTVVAFGMLIMFRYHPRGCFETVMFYLGGQGTFYGWFCFHLGRALRERINSAKMSRGYSATLFGLALSSILVMLHFLGSWRGQVAGPEWFYLPAFLVYTISGWVLLHSLSKLTLTCVASGCWHAIVEYIGQHTMPILILHLMAFKLVNYAGVLLKGDPLFVVAGFPTSYHGWSWTIVYTTVGVVIPIALQYVWGKIRSYLQNVID